MYDHYIALDWAQSNMAIARMTAKSEQIKSMEGPSDLRSLKDYFKRLEGKKIFTIEETTGAQWLYSELKPLVNKLIICDPHRNRLLSEGPKSDRIDATKLVRLLRADMLKEVFHSGDEFIYLRGLTSGYGDLVKSGVCLKNQRSALFRGKGQNHKKDKFESDHVVEDFVLKRLDKQIENYEEQKGEYEKEFKRLAKKHSQIKLLKSVPGIGDINAVQLVAAIVDPKRFESSGKFLSYCGLIKHEQTSGGRVYGKKSSRHCRSLKKIFKLASHSVIQEGCDNPLNDLYKYLINEKKKAPYVARNAVARRIAILVYGVFKEGKKFDPYRRRKLAIAKS